MKPSPPGWPRISSSLSYEDAPAAIEWLCRAFGFEVKLKVEGAPGVIVHSELVYGDGLIMVATAGAGAAHPEHAWRASPRAIDGKNTQGLFVYVDDVEEHFARARAAGARIVTEPTTTDYGEGYWTDRGYHAVDLEGHHWSFAQRLRDPK